MAEEAKLTFEVIIEQDNIEFHWEGYNDSMINYITETLDRFLNMKNLDTSKIFAQVKEKLLLDWKNFYYEQAYRLAFDQFNNYIVNHAIEKWTLREHLQDFTYEKFQEYNANWLKQGRCMWYITGNVDSDVAIAIAENA